MIGNPCDPSTAGLNLLFIYNNTLTKIKSKKYTILFKQQYNPSSFLGFQVLLTSEFGHPNSVLAETVPQVFAVQRRCLLRQCRLIIQY